jgi:hypothetical protein
MTMLTDGLKSQNLEEKVVQLDVAELLERACSAAPEVSAAADTAARDIAGGGALDAPVA